MLILLALAVPFQPDIIIFLTDILRVFDMTAKYGPCVGISRLDRWKRAQKLGLEPPDEVNFCDQISIYLAN